MALTIMSSWSLFPSGPVCIEGFRGGGVAREHYEHARRDGGREGGTEGGKEGGRVGGGHKHKHTHPHPHTYRHTGRHRREERKTVFIREIRSTFSSMAGCSPACMHVCVCMRVRTCVRERERERKREKEREREREGDTSACTRAKLAFLVYAQANQASPSPRDSLSCSSSFWAAARSLRTVLTSDTGLLIAAISNSHTCRPNPASERRTLRQAAFTDTDVLQTRKSVANKMAAPRRFAADIARSPRGASGLE